MKPKVCRVDLDPEIAAEIRRRMAYDLSANPYEPSITITQAVNLILRHVLSEDPSDTLLVVRIPAARKKHPLRGGDIPLPATGLQNPLEGRPPVRNDRKYTFD